VETLAKRIAGLIDPAEDSVRFYLFCAQCASKVKVIGQGVIIQDPDFIVI
jgi:CRISPR/Cas system-associated endoribonuclease Cas2